MLCYVEKVGECDPVLGFAILVQICMTVRLYLVTCRNWHNPDYDSQGALVNWVILVMSDDSWPLRH